MIVGEETHLRFIILNTYTALENKIKNDNIEITICMYMRHYVNFKYFLDKA